MISDSTNFCVSLIFVNSLLVFYLIYYINRLYLVPVTDDLHSNQRVSTACRIVKNISVNVVVTLSFVLRVYNVACQLGSFAHVNQSSQKSSAKKFLLRLKENLQLSQKFFSIMSLSAK